MDLRDQLQATLGNSYTLERELGGGGMSRVFVAEERALGRQVVVKVLSPELAAGVSSERFTREIRLAARLQQANIVPLLAAGETLGLPYYTMPFVDGESLRHRLASGEPLTITQSVNVLRDVARALAYAHDQGVVHRDIKPENVLLSGDAAVVTDFGIAKAISAARTTGSSATITAAGSAIGTPAYIAPEQALGDAGTDHRADIYSLGCVAYELLSGNPPFHGRTAQQMIAAHIHEVPPPVESARPDTPMQLATLVSRCLSKDPAARPQTAREILAALDSIATPVGVSGPASWRGARLRSRATSVAAAALIVVAIVAVAAFVRARQRAANLEAMRALAVMPFVNVGADTTQEYFADGVAIDLTNALSKVPGLRVTSRSLAFSYKGKPIDVRTVGKELQVGALLEGTVQRPNGRVRVTTQLTRTADGFSLWSNSYERDAKDLFAVQDDITKAIASELQRTLAGPPSGSANRPVVAGTSNLEAYDLYLRGVYLLDHRGPGVAKAVEFFRGAIAKDSGFARAYGTLSQALELMPYFSETPAQSIEAPAVAAAERALALDSTDVGAHIGLGLARDHAFRWKDAEAEYRRAVALDSNSAVAHLQLGRHLMHRGFIPEAATEFRKATQLDPVSGTAFVWLAHCYALAGMHDSALVIGRHARDIDPGLLLSRTIGAIDAIAAGRRDDARALVTGLEASPPWKGQAAFSLAMTGDTAGAMTIVRELRMLPQTTWLIHTALAHAYLGLRDTSRALSELEAALRIREITPKWESLADYTYDSVRRSARFAAIVRGFGLDEARFTSPNGGRPTGSSLR
jgi:TolB-like protein/tRNA A-37 threonylcarbamoyl transferase component Bud32/tetratricopeptide (TPR) repeat protein